MKFSSSKVTVLDDNDHVPQFDRAVYSAVVQENNAPGATLLRVTAADPDEGENGRVTYAVQGGSPAECVTVDADTGVVTARVAFDYESTKQAVTMLCLF